jgi:hypothetical protein
MTPLMGGRSSNPWDYFTGRTTFNDDIFECYLLAVNDEECPRDERERRKVESKIKSFTANVHHMNHAKFMSRVQIEWTGRFVITLNDDPASVGMLPEIHASTRDKICFFRTQPYKGQWPSVKETEARIAAELPVFGALLEKWEPPKEVLENTRYGVKSYYDPYLLEASHQQSYAHNFREIIQTWAKSDELGFEGPTWDGKPTDLHSLLCQLSITAGPMRDWKHQQVAAALSSLAKIENSGVGYHQDGDTRHFIITKSVVLKNHESRTLSTTPK